jgi:hypothetical protein
MMQLRSFCSRNALEIGFEKGRARRRFRRAEGSRNAPRRDNETMNGNTLVTHHARTAIRESTRQRQQDAVRSRQNLSTSERIAGERIESGRQMEPSSQIAALVCNHSRQGTSNVPESHSQPDGLIAFLMPNSISFRIAIRIRRTHPGQAVPARQHCPHCRQGERLFLRTPIGRQTRARHASEMARSQSLQWLFRAPPRGVSYRRPTGRAVAIPSSGIRGFFPLTDVCTKRENSVPTCKRGICVPSSTRVRRARTVTDGWAVTGLAPDVRIQWKHTGGLR